MKEFLALILVCWSQITFGQSKNYYEGDLDSVIWDLEQVMVTATRTERQLSALPLPASIIGKKEIAQIQSQRLSDLLEEQSGLVLVPGFFGSLGIQVQGLDPAYTLILLDGMPLVGRTAGNLDLSRISVGNIKQIEIVKGASSSLYGSEALGGVINIITENPATTKTAKLQYRLGSYTTQDAGIQVSLPRFTGFANYFSSRGYQLDPLSINPTVDPFQHTTLQGKYQHGMTTLSARQYIQNSPQNKSNIKESNLHGLLNFNKNNVLEWYTTLYQSSEFLNEVEGYLDFRQMLSRPEWRSNFNITEGGTLTAGVGLNWERVSRIDFVETPDFLSNYIFLQYDKKEKSGINYIAGIRWDRHSEYKSQISPKLSVLIPLSSAISLKSSLGFGFKAPDFRQLYFNFSNSTQGYSVLGYNVIQDRIQTLELTSIFLDENAFKLPLRPERSINLNLGWDWTPGNEVGMSVNLFYNQIQDLIDTRLVGRRMNGQTVFTYQNIASVVTAGLEWNGRLKVHKNLRIQAGYQYLHTADREAVKNFKDGQVFARLSPTSPTFRLRIHDYSGLFNRSRHTANFRVFGEIPNDRISWNTRFTYRSKFGLSDTNGNTYLDQFDTFASGYLMIDLAINKNLGKKCQVSAGIENLLNYRDALNLPQVPGRIFFGKIIYSL